MSACMCGAVRAKEHSTDCPYPYFGMQRAEMDRWQIAQDERKAELGKPGAKLDQIKAIRRTRMDDIAEYMSYSDADPGL